MTESIGEAAELGPAEGLPFLSLSTPYAHTIPRSPAGRAHDDASPAVYLLTYLPSRCARETCNDSAIKRRTLHYVCRSPADDLVSKPSGNSGKRPYVERQSNCTFATTNIIIDHRAPLCSQTSKPYRGGNCPAAAAAAARGHLLQRAAAAEGADDEWISGDDR